MKITPVQLVAKLSTVIDPKLAEQLVTSYGEVQSRFLGGDWKPSELDSGHLCEAAARAMWQLDSGSVTHKLLPGKIIERLEDKERKRSHNLPTKARTHFCRVLGTVYKFRSDRGVAHISPQYTANYMDAMLMIHLSKWIFGEVLRLAWKGDRTEVAQVIESIVQLEHSLVHELDGRPQVQVAGISAPDEILLLLNHAPGGRLSRAELGAYAHHKPNNISMAISRLSGPNQRKLRLDEDGNPALTPLGQEYVRTDLMPKLRARKAA